jgi:competence protein ComEA
MGLYSRQQLTLLLLLVCAAGVGLAVAHWRAGHPEIVERLEGVEREIAGTEDPGGSSQGPGSDGGRVTAPPSGRPSGPERAARVPRAPKRRAEPIEEAAVPLDLNRASLADLARVPGVGPVLARRIVETREAIERFGAVDDLVKVRGVGRAKLERLRPFVSVLE